MARRKYDGIDDLPDMEAKPRRSPRSAKSPSLTERVAKATISKPKLAAFVGGLAVLGGLSLYAFHLFEQFFIRDPRFTIVGSNSETPSTFLITGAQHTQVQALEEVFAEDIGHSLYLVPLKERQQALRQVDWVRNATVARVWPNRLIVRVSERKPVAFITEPDSKIALIDADGVILPPAVGRFELPVLAGVNSNNTPEERREAVDRMQVLIDELGDAVTEISEIDVSDRENIAISQSYEGRIVKLLMGDRNYATRYHNFVSHYDDIRMKLPGATVLDLRLEDRITVEQ